MVSQISGRSQSVRALVVDDESEARQRICAALEGKGIEVTACCSLAEGRGAFDAQPIVLARSPGRGPELNGFVDWVRERSGASQPYIVAIDDAFVEGDAMLSAAANPGCNAVMATPVDDGALEDRLQSIDRWLESHHDSMTTALDRSKTASPFQRAPHPEAVPLDGQIVYSNVLVENAPMAMAMFDCEMRYLVANRKWKEEFKMEELALQGRSHYEVFPSVPESWRLLFDGCLSKGTSECREEDLFQRPDGTTDWVRWEVRPWHGADGSIGGLIVTTEVITERVEKWRSREKELVEERDFYAAIPEHAPVGMVLVDREGKVIYSNPQHMDVLGFNAAGAEDIEAWLRCGCRDEEYAEKVLEVWREKIWRKQLPEVFTLATAEGFLKEVRFNPRLLEDGNMVVSFSDVTDKQRLEEALQASEAKCRALFQRSRVGMALVDESGDVFDINGALESMLGYPRWEIRTKPLSDLVSWEDLSKLETIDPESAEEDPNLGEVEVRLVRRDGESVLARLTASPARDEEGKLLFTAYTVNDFSMQREASGHRPGAYQIAGGAAV